MSALKVHTVFGAESICELKYSQWPDYHNKFKFIYILYNSQLRFDIIKNYFLSLTLIFQLPNARILQWIAIPFSRESSYPRDWTGGSYNLLHWQVGFLLPGHLGSHWEENGNPLCYSCLDNPMERRTWQATVPRITKNQAWLKWLHTENNCVLSISIWLPKRFTHEKAILYIIVNLE